MKDKIYELALKELVKSRPKNLADLDAAKRMIAKKFKMPFPGNVGLLKAYHKLAQSSKLPPGARLAKGGKTQKLLELLRKRKIRSLSGVAIVSVLTKPYKCPGKCLYCPTEKGMPKSYLSNEPAVMRAILNNFDPYKQVQMRLKSLKATGHPTDKIELIVIGGTWSFLPRKYQKWFVMRCFQACNNNLNLKAQSAKPQRKVQNFSEVQKRNEKAKHRIVGITIETRPDFINELEIKWLRELGTTRVEMGVQSIYDDVLRFNLRGHLVRDIIKATQLLKNAGLKICYHLMPNLPGSNLKKDEKMFEEIFKNPGFQPDMLKIYPCAVLKEAPLYKLWKAKKYKPYAEKQLIALLKNIKKKIPYYCRIQRLTRDIPSQSIMEGPAKISNMRQILATKAKKENWRCKCIRCREVGKNYDPKEKLFLFRQEYEASGGKEIFLSFENKSRSQLYSLLRLRIPDFGNVERCRNLSGDEPLKVLPVLKDAAIIRELHTYGQLRPLSARDPISGKSPQHKGLGKKLIKEAEKITKKELGFNKIAVISGIGVRAYYRKLGYKLKDTYMVKNI